MAGELPNLLEPKEVEFELPNGKKKSYILSKFPALQGREILCQYPLSALPKVGDYETNEAMMMKLMAYVAVPSNSQPIRLNAPALVNNHVPDAVTLMKIEREMVHYNFGFFLEEKALTFFERLMQLVDSKISSTLTDLLQQSSKQTKPPLTN